MQNPRIKTVRNKFRSMKRERWAKVEKNTSSSRIEKIISPSNQLLFNLTLESSEVEGRRRCERDEATEAEKTLVAARE